jgi:flagellar biosynthesis/type III secretory pathway protein FliH
MTWSRILKAKDLPPRDTTAPLLPARERDAELPRWSRILKAKITESMALEETAPSFATSRARRMMEQAETTAVMQVSAKLAEAERRAATIAADALERAIAVAEDAAREATEAESAKLEDLRMALAQASLPNPARDDARALERARALVPLLVEEELRASPEKILFVVREILAEARGARRITLEANAEDAKILAGYAELAAVPGASVDVCPSDDLRRGDVRVRTDLGDLDGRVEARLGRLLAALEHP